jgi:hypothetical protein
LTKLLQEGIRLQLMHQELYLLFVSHLCVNGGGFS